MSRESRFMDYNIKNIMSNALQTEDHFRSLTENSNDPGHKSCIAKHLLIISGEAGEGISHATITNPELISTFKKIKTDADRMVDSLPNIDTPEGIVMIRDIRKQAERLNPELNTELCKACGDFENRLENYARETKGLNRESDKSLISIQNEEIDMKDNMKMLAGSFVGKGISEVTSRYVTGSMFGLSNKTLLNLGIGLGIDLLYLKKGKKVLPGKMEVPLVSAANFLIADEVGDLVAGYIPSATVRMAPTARIAPTVSVSNGGVPQFANGKHIYVD